MNILITGVSRGIGYQTARMFAAHKIEKLFLVSRDTSGLSTLEKECRHANHDVEVVTIPYDLEMLVDEDTGLYKSIAEATDQLDIVINNAGYLESRHFEKIDSATATKTFNVNFFAPAELIRQLLPLLRKSPSAHIINISSMGGFQGAAKFTGLSYYSASKAALACLTECLAEEYKRTNIRFNCLALGAVQTEMLEEAFPNYKAPTTAEQMATFIIDFAMNGNKYFNGKIIPVSISTP